MQERGKELVGIACSGACRTEYSEHGNVAIEFADLHFGDRAGAGGYAVVLRGVWKHSKGQSEVAIKQLPVSTLVRMKKEVEILSELKHPKIITLYGTASNDHYLYIVMELAESGSLFEHIRNSRGQPIKKLILHWAVDIAEGMSYLHEKGIAHRDLRSSAVLLTNSDQTAKIGSFGSSRHLDHTTMATSVDSIAWMAPEVLKAEPYSKRCDLYSYGVLLWELATYKIPFEGRNPSQIVDSVCNGERPAIPADVEGYLSTLIQQCWDMDPKARSSFVEVLRTLKPHLEAKDVLAVLEHGDRKIEYRDIQFETNIESKKKIIGSGSYGTVYKGHWKQKAVAIKKVEHKDIVAREVHLMFVLKSHPNIIPLYGAAFENHDLYIVMELAECSLYKHIQDHKGEPDMKQSLRWAVEVAKGMRHLHEHNIAHRDLKTLNSLLTPQKEAKICDFGTARILKCEAQATNIGTCTARAPEVIKGEPYSMRCDLFSYGVVLWELFTHKVPFEEFEAGSVMFQIGNGRIQKVLGIPTAIEAYLSSLICRCWKEDPDERLSFEGILTVLNKKKIIQEHGIRFSDLEFGENIGSGGFGLVGKGHWKSKNRDVTIKLMACDEEIANEISVMSELKRHQNIITLYGTASKAHHLCIVMELAECTLYKHIKDHKGKPDMKRSLRWAVEVAEGMKYLHEKEIAHRDLKSPNVLLTSEVTGMVAKICHFGTAQHMSQVTTIDTNAWMAPEVMKLEPCSKRCDLFSYGVLLWELVTHKVPFDGRAKLSIMMDIIVHGKRLAIPADVEGYLSTLIQHCWNEIPESRPSFAEVLEVLKPHVQEEEITADSKPQLQHLELIPNTSIKVAAEIKHNWQRVARSLNMPDKLKDKIKQQSSDPEQQALAMLKRWLEGGYDDDSEDEEPPTWEILIAALKTSKYKDLARKIEQRMSPST